MIYLVETEKDATNAIVASSFVIDKESNGVLFKDWRGKNVAFYKADDIKSITKA